MRKSLIFLITFFLISIKSIHAYSTDPQEFVKGLINDVISKLSDKTLPENDKKEFIEKIALEHVDISALGLYTLGEIRKSANENDLIEFQKNFEKYFLKTLSSRLSDYSSNIFEVTGAEQKSSNYTIVNSKIIPTDGKPIIKIDWRIYTKNPDNPLIRDLIIEGLSLARTQKEEFSSILNSNDGDINILFKTLEEFSNK